MGLRPAWIQTSLRIVEVNDQGLHWSAIQSVNILNISLTMMNDDPTGVKIGPLLGDRVTFIRLCETTILRAKIFGMWYCLVELYKRYINLSLNTGQN
jgi:hypothetical protein